MKHTKAGSGPSERCRASFALQVDPAMPANTFRGMASVFGTLIDTWTPTRILPGAFANTLAENAARVKVLYQHDPSCPIGLPLKMQETPDGLYVEAEIAADIEDGATCLALMRPLPNAGRPVIDELSIGFDPVKWEMADEGSDQVRLVREVRLWEFSPVTWGANRDAKVMSVHSLRGMGFSPEVVESLMPLLERAAPAEAFGIADAMPFITQLAERHAGKVLSAKNKQLVQDALSALQALIDAAEPPDDGQALTAKLERMSLDLQLACLAARVVA